MRLDAQSCAVIRAVSGQQYDEDAGHGDRDHDEHEADQGLPSTEVVLAGSRPISWVRRVPRRLMFEDHWEMRVRLGSHVCFRILAVCIGSTWQRNDGCRAALRVGRYQRARLLFGFAEHHSEYP